MHIDVRQVMGKCMISVVVSGGTIDVKAIYICVYLFYWIWIFLAECFLIFFFKKCTALVIQGQKWAVIVMDGEAIQREEMCLFTAYTHNDTPQRSVQADLDVNDELALKALIYH